jgi:hypothetical protein
MTSLLLQIQYEGFGNAVAGDSRTTYLVLGGIVAFIALTAILGRGLKKDGKKKTNRSESFSKRNFKKRARQVGLADTHISILLNLIRRFNPPNPMALLHNNRQLDDLLAQQLAELEAGSSRDEATEAKKLAVYHIKQIIERNAKRSRSLASTKTLKVGQRLTLLPESGGKFTTQVAGNLQDSLMIHSPISREGTAIGFKRWTRMQVRYWRDSGEMFSFHTKVIGNKMVRGVPHLLIQQSKNVQVSQQRKFRRKELGRPAYYWRIGVVTVGQGRKAQKRAIVDERHKGLGTIADVSSGGCGIRTTVPLKQGELIKVQFETDRRTPVIAFGKVVGVSKPGFAGRVMHIQFTRVSRRNLNQINAFVYENLAVEAN